VSESKGLRRALVLAQARSILAPVAQQRFLGLLAPKEFEALFDSPVGACKFIKVMGNRLAFWELEEGFTVERIHALRVSVDLLFEIATFGHTLEPQRASIRRAQRTARRSFGNEYCKLCFRPSHRYRLSHKRTTSHDILSGVRPTPVLFTVFSDDKLPLDTIDKIKNACPKHCEETHSLSGDLATKNKKNRPAEKRGNALVDKFKDEYRNLNETLNSLGLATPKSYRLKRMAAWYRIHPRLARWELRRRFEAIATERPLATAIAGHILSALPGVNHDSIHLDDGVLAFEIAAREQAIVVRCDGEAKPVGPPGLIPSEHCGSFDECMRRVLALIGAISEELSPFDIALFEKPGIEIAIARNLIRLTFESPDWLRLACGLNAPPSTGAE